MNQKPPLPAVSRIWQRISMALVAGMLLYFAFFTLNTLGLPNRTGVARVLDKAYYPPGTEYQTLNINGRIFVRPYDTAEAYVLKLQLDNQEAGAIVEKNLYDSVNLNTDVRVTYQCCRITKTLRVVKVTAPAPKGEN